MPPKNLLRWTVLFALCLLWVLSTDGLAQVSGDRISLTVNSFPKCKVYLDTAAGKTLLGHSGAELKFVPPILLDQHGQPAQYGSGILILEAPDHNDLRVSVGSQDWTSGALPKQGVYRLQAATSLVAFLDIVKFYKVPIGALTLLAAVVLVVVVRRRRPVVVEKEPAEVSSDPLIGRKLAGYTVQKRLGSGGAGTVYRVTDETGDYAAKVLYHDRVEKSDLERFRREYRLLEKVNHPVFPRVFDYRETESMAFLIMELVQGETLRASVVEGGRPWADVAPWMESLLDGMGCAHALGIVHRDLKPENIMLADGKIRILDFGLARWVEGKAITKTGEAFGTPKYIAPEQVFSTGTDVDGRTDQYSLGILCYELLSGKVPFDGNDPHTIIARHLGEEPAPMDCRVQPTSGVQNWVMRLLDKNVSNRFHNCQEALDEMKKLDSGPGDGGDTMAVRRNSDTP